MMIGAKVLSRARARLGWELELMRRRSLVRRRRGFENLAVELGWQRRHEGCTGSTTVEHDREMTG
jgi:hypothetical protein